MIKYKKNYFEVRTLMTVSKVVGLLTSYTSMAPKASL